MKPIILTFILAICLLPACNNNKKTPGTEDKQEKKDVPEANTQEASDEIQKRTEALQELSSMSEDEIKALFPEELISAKKSAIQANSVNGTGIGRGQYILNDSAELRVSIADCGGPGGAGYYNRQAMNMLNDLEDKSNTAVDFKGEKALQHCSSNEAVCSFTYFGGDRFWVIIEGRNISPDELKRAAGELKLK